MTRTRRALVLAAGLCAALALAPASQAQETDHGAMDHGGGRAKADASKAMMSAMATMNTAMSETRMTGEPGHDFAAMMIPHHEAAIDMAKAYLDSGEDDADLTRMANEIIAAQEREISELKGWLTDHGR